MDEFDLVRVSLLKFEEAKEYVSKYFVPLRDGLHAVYINGSYQLLDKGVVRSTYFDRMEKEIEMWYFKKFKILRTIEYKLNKPLFYEDKLNLCPPLKHQAKPFAEFNEETKKRVKIMLDYIFEVLSSGSKEIHEFLLKWLSNMLKGNKNNSCLYLKSIQGVGKSTLFSFIRDFVIGKGLCLETGSEPIKSRFNYILGGKLLVVLEELENFSTNEWQVVSTRLKRYITSNTITLEKKGVDSYDSENLNNYVILSNNDAIKDDNGRRYFILDVSTHREGDQVYWDNIYKKCFNDEVGSAFFSYILEINTDDFNPQLFPLTENKKDSYAKRLTSVELFLKEHYVLLKKAIENSYQGLYDEYSFYCHENSKKAIPKIELKRTIKELGLGEPFKSDKVNKYKISYELLLLKAKQHHWIHDLDDFVE